MREVRLDERQQQVLEAPAASSFAVVGAPGSGKTTVLLELVADRVGRLGMAPEEILVLASSRQGATRLRDQVALRLGVPSNGPLARTANSAAFEIVRRGARESMGRDGRVGEATGGAVAAARPVALLTGAEQDRIVAELLLGGIEDAEAGRNGVRWPESLPPQVRRLREFRTELRELMMRATENGVSAEGLVELGRRERIAEWVAAGEFLAEYHRALESYDVAHLDSAELLAEARRILRVEHAKGPTPEQDGTAATRGGIRLVVADDFPEYSVGAVNLVREFARGGAAVVVFGDPDTATAGFRGSDVRALGQLGQTLGVPTAPTIVLGTTYRQHGDLRSLSQRVTERIGTAAAGLQRRTVEPGAGGGAESGAAASNAAERGEARVLRIQADNRTSEIATIARLLRERFLLEGTEWSQMAVIVRSGSLVPAIARGLALAEVPTRTLSAVQALRDDYAARHLAEGLALGIGRLELTAETASSVILGPLCGVDAVGLRRLRLALRHDELAAGGSRHSDELLCEALLTPGVLATIDSAPARRVAALGTTLAALRSSFEAGATVEELLWELWQRTGLATRWGALAAGTGILADEANRNLDGAVALFTAARRAVEREPERPAELFIDEFLTAEVPEDTLSPRSRADSVLVTTPSGAVGLDVEVVVVAGLQESVWPNLRLRGSLLHAQRLGAVATEARLEARERRADGTFGETRTRAPGVATDQVLDERSVASDSPVTSGSPFASDSSAASGRFAEPAAAPTRTEDSRAEVLSDELRMFALAVSRSRRVTVLSGVANDDEQPSAFLALAPDAETVKPVRHPLSLRGLTGHLRRRLAEEGDLRAASALARLAAEEVAGAHPRSWYGLLPASTEEPVVDPDDPEAVVRVSPSRIEAFEESPLMWFVDQVAGGAKGLAAGIGTIVHSVMEQLAADPETDPSPEELLRRSEERWKELRFEAPWIEERERRALGTKLEGLSDYLRGFSVSGGELVGAEAGFRLRQGRAEVNGSIDRIERRADGTVVVIDLKTGKYPAARGDMPRHAQLATYQLAVQRRALRTKDVELEGDAAEDAAPQVEGQVAAGGAAEVSAAPEPFVGGEVGGAELLYVAKGERPSRYTIRRQDALGEPELTEIAARIEAVAEGMAAATFRGVAEPEERDFQNRYEYRIQLIKAVSE
ncbi:PD-(D/E)XK nuclease family protein [Herbiconiux sp. CPCC 203407]|uniref:DNA 3'-5' helicase n=1 Tax=Herbiconiux oxytropis TaxID=2970915 RepID=A0AA41XHG0_9MICO|nr:UrvD/REP family ATP-dependent DNA helicase [Herbiconiux oxytropis]MCS5721232.1 PD-(D/E)XK nuclease family protein [Herbiconiux oxytropis]MCS5726329.1 PD-(D/E)XK nuclease family protein [Herbiconiux oxytropis]